MKEISLKYKEYKDRWAGLALRDRRAILICLLAIIVFIFYQWMWMPYLDTLTQLRKKIQKDQVSLQWMKAADKALIQLESQTSPKKHFVSSVIFLGLVQKRIDRAGLHDALTQLKQSTNETIEIHFQKVEFDKLMSLLIGLVKEQKVDIIQMSVLASNSPGLIDADIILGLAN